MKYAFVRNILIIVVLLGFTCIAPAATITYTFDAQHRLVQTSYSASQKSFISYDAAGNVDQQVMITDAKYLQSWLWYFSMLGYPGYHLSPAMSPFRGNI